MMVRWGEKERVKVIEGQMEHLLLSNQVLLYIREYN